MPLRVSTVKHMNVWETAILKTFEFLGGCASNREIYENVGKFITLTAEHRRHTTVAGPHTFVR